MTDSTKKPEFREDDSWFSKEQLTELAPADHADPVHSPIPTQMVSNGEYMPIGQTDKQKEVEARLAALSAQAAKQLGMSRRSTPSGSESANARDRRGRRRSEERRVGKECGGRG